MITPDRGRGYGMETTVIKEPCENLISSSGEYLKPPIKQIKIYNRSPVHYSDMFFMGPVNQFFSLHGRNRMMIIKKV